MWIVLDLLLLAVLCISVILGYRRGFVRSLLGALSFVIALLTALLFSAPLAKPIRKHLVYPALYKTVDASLRSFEDGEELTALLEDGAAGLQELLDRFGVSREDARRYASSAEESGKQLREGFISMIAGPISDTVSEEIAFALLFFLTLLVCFLLQMVLDLVAKLPGLHRVNQIFGGALGLVYGGILLLVLTSVISRFWPLLTAVDPSVFPADAMEKSLFCRFFIRK